MRFFPKFCQNSTLSALYGVKCISFNYLTIFSYLTILLATILLAENIPVLSGSLEKVSILIRGQHNESNELFVNTWPVRHNSTTDSFLDCYTS